MKTQLIFRRRIAAVATVVAIVAVTAAACRISEEAQSATSPASRYDTIQAERNIRVGYAVGAPLFTIDPNTKTKSGIFYEIVERAASKLGFGVTWSEEVGYGEMIQGLVANRYDIVGSGVWINAARGKDADFTIPVYYDAVLAYARDGDTRFDNDLGDLNSPNYRISTMDGELGATIAASDFPQARTEALPQLADFTQLILNVINEKADVVFLALAPARLYQAQNPGKIHAVGGGRPVRVFPVALLIPKGDYKLKQALDYALAEMLMNGEIESILRKYEKAQGSFLRVAQPYRVENTRQ